MSLARNAFVQSFMTLGSRVLGFGRDIAANAIFGVGPLMDAWTTALMFPNLFRRLFAEGAFSQSFVPIYAKDKAANGDEAASRTASETLSFLLAVVAAFTIAMQIAMPWLMPWLLSAYRDEPQVLRIATLMTQLTMPYLACMTLASLLSGVLNTAGRFALAAGAPILLNVCTLAALLLIPDEETAAIGAAIAVTGAGVLQAALLWWGAARLGAKLRIGLPAWTPVVSRVVVIAIPGALAGGALQINALVSQYLAGSNEGARSVLYNADRLYQLPLGLIGVAVGMALVPRLARHFVADDRAGAQGTMSDAIGLSMAFTFPAAVALLVMPYFIIDATLTRGAFTSVDAARTADVLRHFAWGVPAFVLAKVLTPPFLAQHDTRRPMQYAIVSMVVNTLLGAALFFGLARFGVDPVVGLAIATSTAGWVNVAQLAGALARDRVYTLDGAAASRLLRLGGASVLMGLACGVAAMNYAYLRDVLISKEIAVLVVCFAAFALYCLMALALRAVRPAELRAALRRERGPDLGGGPGGTE